MKNTPLLLVFVLLVSCGGETDNDDLETKIPENQTSDSSSTSIKEQLVIHPGGDHREYHPNGQIKIEGQYDMNKQRTGLWISYYDNGIKWSESFYVDGKKEGHSITFFPNGSPRYVGEYKDDKQTGLWTFYDEEGNVIKEEEY